MALLKEEVEDYMVEATGEETEEFTGEDEVADKNAL